MRRWIKWLIAAGALGLPAASFAADMPIKAPVAVQATQPYSGLYFGALGAVAKTPTDVAFLDIAGTGNIKPSGAMAGVLVGAGTWMANGLFLGVEADASYDFSKAKQPCSLVANCTVKSGWFMTQRVVIGAQLGDITGAVRRAAPAAATQWRDSLSVPATLSASTMMPYITGGIAERRIEACVNELADVVIEPGPLPAATATAEPALDPPAMYRSSNTELQGP